MEVFPASTLELGAVDYRKTVLFICDMQEKYRSALYKFKDVLENTKKVMAGCHHMEIPILISEQDPEGLGHTVKEIDRVDAKVIVSKMQFSMMTPEVLDLMPTLCDNEVACVILCGVEVHVAIEQTAMDLLSRGYYVHVVTECVTSRTKDDRTLALQRLAQIGCFVSTVETVLFKLLGSKGHSKYKPVAQIVKNPGKTDTLSYVL